MTSPPSRPDSASARRDYIVTTLRTTGFLSVAHLSSELGISEMTVRRDLRKLEQTGAVRVVRGGASLPHGALHNRQPPVFAGRARAQLRAKQRIARTARERVTQGETVAVDAGTTTYEFVAALPEAFDGCVVTHSVPVVHLLLERSTPRVVGLGGDLFPASQAFVGPMTVDAAAQLRVRTFFLGAAAIDARGVYVAMDIERPTKQALMDIADQVVLLVDRGKFETSAPVLLCSLDRLTAVVTDRRPPAVVASAITAAGVQLVVSPEDAADSGVSPGWTGSEPEGERPHGEKFESHAPASEPGAQGPGSSAMPTTVPQRPEHRGA